MNSLERLQAFEAFVNACDSTKYGEKQWVGQGNPQANILIVGMEPAINSDAPENVIMENIKWVKDCLATDITKLECRNIRRSDVDDKGIKKFRGNHTWIVCQKLINFIYQRQSSDFLDFGKYTFATEMNNWVSKRKAINSKNRELFEKKLLDRRKLFKESQFIQDFPVVILACSNYIVNNKKERQIDDTFEVKFDADGAKGERYRFWTHHSQDRKRMVIHTRQLSSAIPDDMLKSISMIIREHLAMTGNI